MRALISKILGLMQKKPKPNFGAEKKQNWLDTKRKHIKDQIRKARALVEKYEIGLKNDFYSCGAPESIISEIPDFTHGYIPNTMVMITVTPDDFANIIAGENIRAIEMLIPYSKAVLSPNVPRIFLTKIEWIIIVTETSFNRNAFFEKAVYQSLLYQLEIFQGQCITFTEFLNYLKEKGILFFDPVFNASVINIFVSYYRAGHPTKPILIVLESNDKAD